jgi:hypothetical protein
MGGSVMIDAANYSAIETLRDGRAISPLVSATLRRRDANRIDVPRKRQFSSRAAS